MVFKSGKAVWVGLLIWGVVGLMVYTAAQLILDKSNDPWDLIILVLITGLLLWFWFGTYYEIKADELKYRSGPVHGTIRIENIRKIIVGKTSFVGLKPSLDNHGCIIAYNKYDEIYLSPKNKAEFVAELLKINPAIEVAS